MEMLWLYDQCKFAVYGPNGGAPICYVAYIRNTPDKPWYSIEVTLAD